VRVTLALLSWHHDEAERSISVVQSGTRNDKNTAAIL
jgi:hypothetical protein